MNSESVFWKIAVPVIVALLVGGTSPWWWQEFFSQSREPDSPSADPPIATPTPDSPTPTPSAPTRTSIRIAYRGDYDQCSLPILIDIGDQSLYPSGKGYVFQYNNVEVGQQPYQVEGQIQCPTLGNCQASGSGSINVIPGNEYYIYWSNVAFGQCNVSLAAQ